MSETRIRSYEGADITVRYDAGRCIHAAECVRGLRRVFDSDAKPWIDPDAAPADDIVDVIHKCPTGALSYERADESRSEAPPAVPSPVELMICADGPIYVHGDLELMSGDGESKGRETRLALCRCGASANKPFCDNSHTGVKFLDAGEISTDRDDNLASAGNLVITPLPNGPVLLRGPFVLTSADGSRVFRGEKAALCRCGESANKPFCDGVHARIGFQSD